MRSRYALVKSSWPPQWEEQRRTLFQVQGSRFKVSAHLPVVGVGIMVAHNPLHGSGRAALLHPALALGNNAKALPRIRVTNVSLRDPASHSALHLSPGYTGFLATALKHPPPEPSHGHAKVTDRHRIHRHRVIAHISENHRPHILPHCGNRGVHASPDICLDFLELDLTSHARRPPQHHG